MPGARCGAAPRRGQRRCDVSPKPPNALHTLPCASRHVGGLESAALLTPRLPFCRTQMFCWDESSCNMRYATHDYYMSSIKKPWSYDFAQGGIFATDGSSPWGTANRVYVKCVTTIQPCFGA